VRISVIGAGAIGATIAVLLHNSGHAISVVARGAQRDALSGADCVVDGVWGQHRARLRVLSSLTELVERPELTIVATKAHDSAAAISEAAVAIAGSPLLVVQNGLDGIADAARLVPNSPIVGGLALFAASLVEPGRVTITGPGTTFLGSAPGEPPTTTLAVAELLTPVLPVEATSNFAGCQWTKLVINQVNALPAITGLSVQQTATDARLRPILLAGMRETVRVGLASGVTFGSLQGLDHSALTGLIGQSDSEAGWLPDLLTARMGAVPNPGSTLQSIARGQLTEIDYLNGAVVRRAHTVGLPAPVNSALVSLVHEVEGTGTFLSPTDVSERLRSVALPN
jgi:2-dehydropantoate 2-reductase